MPLAAYALALSTLCALPLGLLAAARRGRRADSALTGVDAVGLAVPNFWLGMILVLVFAVTLHWVVGGRLPRLAGAAGGRHSRR